MKKILITGVNSYIGTCFKNYLDENYVGEYLIEFLDLKDDNWTNKNLCGYEIVIHVAGIVHQSKKNISSEVYYSINRDLTIKFASIMKKSGTKQFIFLSTMSVYGKNNGVINESTLPKPTSYYGKSKYEAEQSLLAMNCNNFKVCILRPPMVYGNGCKGNYNHLRKIAELVPLFIDIKNQRSMIYIENLCIVIKNIIENGDSGIFFPQNKTYVSTSKMVKLIAKYHNKNIYLVPFPKCIIQAIPLSIFQKVFGDLIYTCDIPYYEELLDFEITIKKSEEIL